MIFEVISFPEPEQLQQQLRLIDLTLVIVHYNEPKQCRMFIESAVIVYVAVLDFDSCEKPKQCFSCCEVKLHLVYESSRSSHFKRTSYLSTWFYCQSYDIQNVCTQQSTRQWHTSKNLKSTICQSLFQGESA